MANIFEEEKVKLRPLERISTMIDVDRFRRELETFERFPLSKSNVSYFTELVKAKKENAINFIDDRLERIFSVLKIHPSFGKFFTQPLEGDSKKRTEERDPYGILITDLIKNMEEIIKELRGLVPFYWQYVQLDQIFSEQIIDFIEGKEEKDAAITTLSSPNTRGPKKLEWGEAKGDKAYLMAADGKSYEEIAVALGIQEVKQVRAHIDNGIKRGIKFGVIEPSNHSNQNSNQENNK